MKKINQKNPIFSLCGAIILILCLNIFPEAALASENQISIRMNTTHLFQNLAPSEVYSKVQIKIRPYESFRLAFKLLMDDGEDIWIYYSSTDTEPQPPEYEGGPFHFGLGATLIDGEWKILEREISLDLENFIVSKIQYIQEIEILGNRYDLAFILAYHEMDDSDLVIIDDFSTPGQDLEARGWESEDMDKFTISFDSDMQGYLKAEYTEPDDTEDDQDDTQDQTTSWYYYPYGSSYYGGLDGGGYYGGNYGSNYYSGGYYGGLDGSGYYGGSYGGNYYSGGYYGGLYGGGYYGGSYGGGLYGGNYYSGGYYGGLYGGSSLYSGGGLYGLGLGLYGGLYGLRNYFGGPI